MRAWFDDCASSNPPEAVPPKGPARCLSPEATRRAGARHESAWPRLSLAAAAPEEAAPFGELRLGLRAVVRLVFPWIGRGLDVVAAVFFFFFLRFLRCRV